MVNLHGPKSIVVGISMLLLSQLQGCATNTQIISSESDKSNSDAVQMAQRQLASSEAKGCKAISISGGPSVALGLVIGDACVDCQPIQQNQRRQVYVVNILMRCPGAGGVSPI